MSYVRAIAFGAILAAGVGGCGQSPTTPWAAGSTSARQDAGLRALPNSGSSKIQHVVIIIQENRTVNDLFNGYNGATTVRTINLHGKTIHLKPISLTAPYDISHAHSAFLVENAGNWNKVASTCKKKAKCPPPQLRALGYVPQREVAPYFVMARRYAFADDMFQTNQGPSFPAHQYLLSGTSTISDGSSLRAAENPLTPAKKLTGGCDSITGTLVKLIDQHGNENKSVYPCFDRNSLIQLIEAQSLTWHYYQSHLGPGLWNAPDAIKPVWESSQFSTDVVAPPSQFLTDIAAGNLSTVTWIAPTAAASDHAGITNGSGPSWVASVVNAIGESQFWDSTAIFVTWDDWGGWYDPVSPPLLNSYELSFRVPLLVISPYAKQHYISRVQHEFGSILKFTEEAFNLGSLGTTDVRADDLSDCFNFMQNPRRFVPIPSPLHADYFLRQPVSNAPPDEDL